MMRVWHVACSTALVLPTQPFFMKSFVSVVALVMTAVTAAIGCGTPSDATAEPAVDDYTSATETDPSTDPNGPSGGDASTTPTRDADAGNDAGPGVCEKDASSTFQCSGDGERRSRCAAGVTTTETCARGCLREPAGTDSVCMGTTTTWSCPGSYGTTKARDGDYYITAFGCWKDAAGVSHGDGQDNCIPSCLAKAKSAGLCLPGDTGKQCEERVTWYTADAARFGCLARLKVTNPKTGKSVIAVALDYGPSCPAVENKVSKAVLDASGRVDRQLFGSDQGVYDRALVHVVEVDAKTPLGPTSP